MGNVGAGLPRPHGDYKMEIVQKTRAGFAWSLGGINTCRLPGDVNFLTKKPISATLTLSLNNLVGQKEGIAELCRQTS
jgi:hypothetical protein